MQIMILFSFSECGVMQQLVSGEGGGVLLTQAEKERLAELLQEVDKEEEDSARGVDSEVG